MRLFAMVAIALVLAGCFAGCVNKEGDEDTAPVPETKIEESTILAAFEYKMTDEGLAVDASSTNDTSGNPLRYIWNWGDGTFSAGLKTYHCYDIDGLYKVSLCVDDGFGGACYANATLNTNNADLQGTCAKAFSIKTNATAGNNTDKWAIIDGVSDYPGTENDLPDCHIDGLNLYHYLVDNCSFPPENVFLFLNMSATPKNIKSAVDFIAKHTTEASEFVYYHSGHGPTIGVDASGGVLESGICVCTNDWNDVYTIVRSELKAWFDSIKSQKFVFISDSCFAGEFSGVGPGQLGLSLTDGLSAPGRVIVCASCEAMMSGSTGDGGAFTIPFLVWGLVEGKADGCSQTTPPNLVDIIGTKDGKISIQEAYWYAFYILETGQGPDPTALTQIPDMSDNCGEPLFL